MKFLCVEGVVGELGMRPPCRWMTPFVLWIQQLFLLPGEISDSSESGQVIVAVVVVTRVELEDGSPIRKEEEVRQPSSVHSDENIGVVCQSELLSQRHLRTVVDDFHVQICVSTESIH